MVVQERVEVEVDEQGVGVRGDKHMAMVMKNGNCFQETRIDVASYVVSHARAQKDYVCVLNAVRCARCADVLTHPVGYRGFPSSVNETSTTRKINKRTEKLSLISSLRAWVPPSLRISSCRAVRQLCKNEWSGTTLSFVR